MSEKLRSAVRSVTTRMEVSERVVDGGGVDGGDGVGVR